MDHLIGRLGRSLNRRVEGVSDEAMSLLQAYEWPGNVRELENVLQRALILSKGPLLTAIDTGNPPLDAGIAPESATPTDVERRHITRVLTNAHWRIEGAGGAARVLGLKPSTLRSRMLKLGIARPR